MKSTPSDHHVTQLSGKRISKLRALYNLTAREAEVCALLVIRRTNREIAAAIGISEHTARHHTESVLRKLGLTSRMEVSKLVPGSLAAGR